MDGYCSLVLQVANEIITLWFIIALKKAIINCIIRSGVMVQWIYGLSVLLESAAKGGACFFSFITPWVTVIIL